MIWELVKSLRTLNPFFIYNFEVVLTYKYAFVSRLISVRQKRTKQK